MFEAQSQHVCCARARARKSIEKTSLSASKIEPGRSKMMPERAKVDVGRPCRLEKRSPNARRAVERKILVGRTQQKRTGQPIADQTRQVAGNSAECMYENSRKGCIYNEITRPGLWSRHARGQLGEQPNDLARPGWLDGASTGSIWLLGVPWLARSG